MLATHLKYRTPSLSLQLQISVQLFELMYNSLFTLINSQNRRFDQKQQNPMNNFTHLTLQPRYEILLPKINFKKINTARYSTKQDPLKFTRQQETEELAKLQEWSNSLPTVKRKRNITSQSIMFLYKSHNKYNPYSHSSSSKFKPNKEGQISAASLYLAQLDNQLSKIRKINYNAIYQNVEYCASIYEIAFNDILKKLQTLRSVVQSNLEYKLKCIQEIRQNKMSEAMCKNWAMSSSIMNKIDQESQNNIASGINSQDQLANQLRENTNMNRKKKFESSTSMNVENKQIENLSNSRNKQNTNRRIKTLVQIRQLIQQKYTQLKPIKKLLQKLEQAKLKVLYSSLQLGYDIREDGLIWILKQLNDHKKDETNNQDQKNHDEETTLKTSHASHKTRQKKQKQQVKQQIIPKISDFPAFLSEQQINFIISKYKNDFKLRVISEEKGEKQQQQKQIIQTAYENVRKDRHRKLSMIKQKQLIQKLLNQKISQRTFGHKYLNADTIRMIQNTQKIKSTKNELIYQQTMRKLNRFCIQETYSKKQKISSLNSPGRGSQINKLMEQVKRMLSYTIKLKDEQEKIKTEQEKQFSVILMKLRNQQYEGRCCSEKRNPISVICCLVGWKKAKKILENEMNISMPASN